MTENIITFPSKLGSNNPKAYGIVNADQVSGHKSVATLDDLFAIPDHILSKSGTNENNDAIGQEWWVQEQNRGYRLGTWENRRRNSGWYKSEVVYKEGTNIVIDDSAPADINDIWAEDDEKSIPEYKNEDLKSIIEALTALQEVVGKHEYAFNNHINPGTFTNNASSDITSVEAEAPEGVEPIEITAEDYPEYAEQYDANAKHISIKAGFYTQLLDNRDRFVDNELLWCVDTQRLYIKSEGTLVWLNKGSSGGGSGDISSDDLDNLNTIGLVAPSGQVYRIKVNDNGTLVVYKKQLDTPQPEPGGVNIENGWEYVTKLYIEKFYINSVYCGGISSNEHSYNYCSHNFVELSNLTDSDINLKGLSIQYASSGNNWEVLPLEGEIKKGSTFLIRGAQCSVMNSNTTRIKVDKYDMEWRTKDGNLIKFDNTKAKFYLTWGTDPQTVASPYAAAVASAPIHLSKGYIDFVGLNVENAEAVNKVDGSEKSPYTYLNSDRIFTKYYSMDPVKQATKALTARSNANDWYFVDLTKDVIPMIEEYTPRASFENKDIFYNKTTLDKNKPNYITCTFGIQATAPNATRCFNWISQEYHDEFIWYRKQGDSEWTQIESFKNQTGYRAYYNRIRSEFTDGTPFVTHKVIIKNLEAGTYEYKVGRDDSYMSDVKTFNVIENPTEFTFVQTSDQQGFRWDEYQIWKEAAKYIKDNVDFNFVINTGDVTQNGNQLNEWLDYYAAREKNFNGIEEMTVIGNNDLCPVNTYQLGRGEDNDKLNPINMRYFYTYELDPQNLPIFNLEGKEIFVDSLYSFNYGNTHFLCMNSEITPNTEILVYGLSESGNIYREIEKWCEKDIQLHSDQTWKIAMCHELPFTILTPAMITNFYWDNQEFSVERGGTKMNTNNKADHKYWFSKFCQNNGIRLVIGGHKHTYAVTFPLIENEDNSMKPIIQVTPSMLEKWFKSDPTALYQDESDPLLVNQYFPSAWINDVNYKTQKHLCSFQLVDKITAPVYLTNQTTGYKHTSNKELPSEFVPWDQYFYPCTSKIISQGKTQDTVNKEQRYPFYTIYEVTNGEIKCTTKKIANLFTSAGKYNVNIPSSSNAPEAIPGNGQQGDNGKDIIIIER